MAAEASTDFTPYVVALDVDGTTINHAREMTSGETPSGRARCSLVIGSFRLMPEIRRCSGDVHVQVRVPAAGDVNARKWFR